MAVLTRLGAIVVVAVAVSACATSVDGTAAREPSTTTDDGVELELLDPGNFPTAPLPAFGTADTPEIGALTEIARLSSFVVLPSDVDPSLVNGSTMGHTYRNAAAIDDLLPVPSTAPTNPAVDVAAAHDFTVGFSSTRFRSDSGPERLALENAVLVFPDDAAAKAAATEMPAAYATTWPDIPNTPIPIPDHPDTIAFTDDFGSGPQVKAFTAYGRYLLYQRAGATTPEAAAALIASTIDAQRTLLADFTPTDPAKFVGLQRDPEGLLARTLPADDYLTTGAGRVRDPAGALHYAVNPVRSQELYADTGLVSVASSGDSTVYATSQDGAALRDGLAELTSEVYGLEPTDGVEGMPNVTCRKSSPTAEGDVTTTHCFGSAGTYAFEVTDLQAVAAHQKAAAQYLMLTAP